MISADRLKPFLLHEDRFLRKAAAEYFHDQWSEDPDLIPLILQACERWGEEDNEFVLFEADQLRLSEPGLGRLLEYMPRATRRPTIDVLNRLLIHMPGELLAAAEPALRTTANVRPETLERLDRRRGFQRQSPEELWRELQAFVARSEDKHYVGEIDHGYADDLIAALAPYAVPDGATLVRTLEDTLDSSGWLPTFLVDLAGARRLRSAVPVLIHMLGIDTDYDRERANVALARIGDVEAVRMVRARWGKWPWHARLYASEVLDNVKHPETEDALLFLMEREKKVDLRTNLCAALCKQFSERGIEVVRRQIHRGYDSMVAALPEDLVTTADILGVPLPESEAWRKEREEHDRKFRRSLMEMEEWEARPQPVPRLPPSTFSVPSPSPLLTALNSGGRRSIPGHVGRNDPCPCGSGKKYKKCCGSKQG